MCQQPHLHGKGRRHAAHDDLDKLRFGLVLVRFDVVYKGIRPSNPAFFSFVAENELATPGRYPLPPAPLPPSACHTGIERRPSSRGWSSLAVLWGPSTPNKRGLDENPHVMQNRPIFPICMWIYGGSAPYGQARSWQPKNGFITQKRPRYVVGPLLMGQKNANLPEESNSFFGLTSGPHAGYLVRLLRWWPSSVASMLAF